MRLWEVSTQRLVATLDTQLHRVHCLAFSPDGRMLAAGNAIGLQLWDVERQAVVHDWRNDGLLPDVYSAAFSPDG